MPTFVVPTVLVQRIADLEARLAQMEKLMGIARPDNDPKFIAHPQLPKHPTIASIMTAVSVKLGHKLISFPTKEPSSVEAKHIGMYLARKLTPRSLPEIARAFGYKDHTTALHAIRKIEAKRKVDAKLDQMLNDIVAALAPASKDEACA